MTRRTIKTLASICLAVVAASSTIARADIRVGWQTGVANVILTYGIAKGKFEHEGAHVELKPFGAGPAMLPSLAGSEIDLGWMGEFPAVTGFISGLPIEIVAVQALLPTDVRLVANPSAGIATPADLKGKKIGVAIGSTSHFHILVALKAAGLAQADVTLVNTAPANMLAAYQAGQVDAVFTWEPGSGEIEKLGGKRIATTESLGIMTGLFGVARKAYVESNEKELVAFLRGWQACLDDYKRDPNDVLAPEAARLKMSVADLAGLLARQNAIFPDLGAQLGKDALGSVEQPQESRLLAHVKGVGEFLVSIGRAKELPTNFAPLIERGPLARAIKAGS